MVPPNGPVPYCSWKFKPLPSPHRCGSEGKIRKMMELNGDYRTPCSRLKGVLNAHWGLHEGLVSLIPTSMVSGVGFEPSAFITQISLPCWKAIVLPSGDQEGYCLP